MKKKEKNKHYDIMLKDPDNWKASFYVNSKDPRVIVPKKNPKMGWTLNFGNVYSYLLLIAIIILLIASKYLV
ncbi:MULTISPECIES: DUF5808 domain-containing protein [unclassified Lentimicrobium]|uniref:DUF5808 domain-containing protein n=1 Tax=unclassified Lentimicrobium TaxID=2677434 RepID=UPI001C130F9D|nr:MULTISPECIES: DUF5808 domain-containing protein [unclassified Lentimicrobium]